MHGAGCKLEPPIAGVHFGVVPVKVPLQCADLDCGLQSKQKMTLSHVHSCGKGFSAASGLRLTMVDAKLRSQPLQPERFATGAKDSADKEDVLVDVAVHAAGAGFAHSAPFVKDSCSACSLPGLHSSLGAIGDRVLPPLPLFIRFSWFQPRPRRGGLGADIARSGRGLSPGSAPQNGASTRAQGKGFRL